MLHKSGPWENVEFIVTAKSEILLYLFQVSEKQKQTNKEKNLHKNLNVVYRL